MSVAEHYNQRPNQNRRERNASPIRALRGFNNWIKSMLIQHWVPASKPHVLDMCGGKGGDLGKWMRAGASSYVLVDIAADSVRQAQTRFNARKQTPITRASFHVGDAFDTKVLPQHKASFDVVSCQFALHYSFETPQRAHQALSNVARLLKPGGIFLCTVPDWRVLKQKRAQHGLIFGNALYRVAFDSANPTRYTFTLKDAIDGCAEYVIPLPQLRRLAARVGLSLIFGGNFHSLYDRYGHTREARHLMQRMGAFDTSGTIPVEQWDAIRLYAGYVFRKKINTDNDA